jgi:hypothetical protein
VKYSRHVWLLNALLLPILVSFPLAAQTLPSASVSLQQLNLSASVIFSGTVLQLERVVAPDAKPAFVRVKFRVDEAVRGCHAGETVTLDEWAELWMRGDRYRKGQRVLIFLYPPSQTGVSSPVAGDVGTFTTGPDGLLRTTPLQVSTLATQATSSQSGARPTHGESDPQITRPRLRSNSEPNKRSLYDEAGE